MPVEKQLPRYKCHKEVYALKIAAIEQFNDDSGAYLIPAEPGFAKFGVDREYVRKHKPQVGGYYVVYDDGYQSWSPAKAFEDGYTLLTPRETGDNVKGLIPKSEVGL